MRTLWAATLPLAMLAAGSLVAAPTPAMAAPATTLSPSNPITMERFNFYSGVPTKFVRPVVLQKKVGSSWKTIFSGNTAANGKYRFTVHTGSVDTLRSYAGSTTYKDKTYPALSTPPITVTPVTQSTALAMASTTAVGASLSATAVTTPARAGRGVSLQVLKNDTWTTIASGTVAANGRGTFHPKAPAKGTYSYRIVTAGWNGASPMASAPVKVTVKGELVPNGAVASLTAPNLYGDFVDGPYPDNGWYAYNWAQPDGIYLYKDGSGSLHTVTPSSGSLTITTVDTRSYKTTSTKIVSMPSYPIWGGFYAAPDGNFYTLSGRENLKEQDSLTVVAIRKFDSSWNLKGVGYLKGGVSHGSLKGVYRPFDAGSASMTLSGSTLLVDMPRLMYGISGVHHQSNLIFEVNTSTMSAKTSDELGGDYVYSSHSFNQLAAIDGHDLVTADHGDAYPRAIQLGVTRGLPSSRSTRTTKVFSFPGQTGDNYTGTTLTGLQVGSGRALTAGNSVPNGHPVNGVNGSNAELNRNIYLTTTDLNSLSTTFTWITTFSPSKGATRAEQPRMVKLSDNRFVLLFNVTDGKTETLNYRLIDQNGNILASKSWKGVSYSSNSQPVLAGSQLYWANFVGTSNGWPRPNYLYQMNLTNPSAPSLVE